MFHILNTLAKLGKNSPMVCKFLHSLSVFRHALFPGLAAPFYLLEQMRLRNPAFRPIGLRIALPVRRTAFVPIFKGKA